VLLRKLQVSVGEWCGGGTLGVASSACQRQGLIAERSSLIYAHDRQSVGTAPLSAPEARNPPQARSSHRHNALPFGCKSRLVAGRYDAGVLTVAFLGGVLVWVGGLPCCVPEAAGACVDTERWLFPATAP
jgi:hypothetical protein